MHIQKIVERDLNEFVKWVILIGLYLFYRMMEKAYDEKDLTFLVIPLIVLAILAFIIDWIIKYLVASVHREEQNNQRSYWFSRIISGLLYISLSVLITFYFFEWVPLINLGIFLLLATAMLAKYRNLSTTGKTQKWNLWLLALLFLMGVTGLIHAFAYNNYLNVTTFLFYVLAIVYYYLNLYFSPKQKQER